MQITLTEDESQQINTRMTTPYPFHYNAQFKKYIGQFLRIFSGLQVQDGVDRDGDGINDMRAVAVHYGNSDRIINALNQNQGTFTSQKIPIISAYLTAIRPGDEYRIPKHHQSNVSYLNSADGQYHTVSKIAGVPYVMSMDLHIYTSSTEQLFQLLEQILLIFNPEINFQKSSELLDPAYITKVVLTGITDNSNFPIGQQRRLILQTLTFDFVAWLMYPYTDTEGVIDTIYTHIHDSSLVVEDLDLAVSPPDGPIIETAVTDSSTEFPPSPPTPVDPENP